MENEKLLKEFNYIYYFQIIIIFITTIMSILFFYFLFNFKIIMTLVFLILLILIGLYLKNLNYIERLKEYYISYILCLIFSYSLIRILYTNDFCIQIHIYYISLVIYHFAEYFSVLIYHFNNLTFHSFLIDQSKEWMITTGASFLEFYIENFFFHKYKCNLFFIIIGVICLIIGHIFRIGALFTGKKNFTHLISYKKKNDHVLVTNGIYSISRHPSYFGFYLWSMGTEIITFNPICFIAYLIILFKFFDNRIKEEEELLIEFFGQEYIDYRNKVPILIPFIKLDEIIIKNSLTKHKFNKEIKKNLYKNVHENENDDDDGIDYEE